MPDLTYKASTWMIVSPNCPAKGKEDCPKGSGSAYVARCLGLDFLSDPLSKRYFGFLGRSEGRSLLASY